RWHGDHYKRKPSLPLQPRTALPEHLRDRAHDQGPSGPCGCHFDRESSRVGQRILSDEHAPALERDRAVHDGVRMERPDTINEPPLLQESSWVVNPVRWRHGVMDAAILDQR